MDNLTAPPPFFDLPCLETVRFSAQRKPNKLQSPQCASNDVVTLMSGGGDWVGLTDEVGGKVKRNIRMTMFERFILCLQELGALVHM